MPQQTEHAIPTKIEALSSNAVGSKLRLAGRSVIRCKLPLRCSLKDVCRMLSYEPLTGLALLLDGEHGIIVDVSLCADRYSTSWTRERLCLAMVIGYVETSPVSFLIRFLNKKTEQHEPYG